MFFHLASSQFNPTILQDSRDLPKVDGTFGFLYRTEDGIAHAAKGDSNGVIHGRFSYTDPTGLKVNYNYNAGSRVAPGYSEPPSSGQYQQPKAQQQQPKPQYQQPQPRREEYREPPQYDYEETPQYVEPEPQYVPRTRPSARTQQSRPSSRAQYSAQYRQPVQSPPAQRRTRPVYSTHNDVYDDYSN